MITVVSLMPAILVEITSCLSAGLSTDAIQIDSIIVSPDPPKPGEDMTVTVKASALEVVEVRPATRRNPQ
jgi:hypothetical protein